MSELLNNAVIEIVIGGAINVTKTEEFRRRIAFVAEKTEILIPIGENMTLYKAKARNVSSLSIKPATSSVTTWQNVPLNSDISISISGNYDLLAKVEKSSTDSESSVYLFTSVIE